MNQRTKENILWLPTIFATAMLLAIIFNLWAQDALDHTRNKVAIYKLQKLRTNYTNTWQSVTSGTVTFPATSTATAGATPYYFLKQDGTSDIAWSDRPKTNEIGSIPKWAFTNLSQWTNATSTATKFTVPDIEQSTNEWAMKIPASYSFRLISPGVEVFRLPSEQTNGVVMYFGSNTLWLNYTHSSDTFQENAAAICSAPGPVPTLWTDTNGVRWQARWEKEAK